MAIMPAPFEVIEFQAEGHSIEFLKTRSFSKEANKTFTEEQFFGLLTYLSANPDAGLRMPGTAGLRKIRWGAKGSGKRGGARVIYYFRDLNMPLLLLAVYPKNNLVRLSVKKMREIEQKVEYLIEELACTGAESDRVADRRA